MQTPTFEGGVPGDAVPSWQGLTLPPILAVAQGEGGMDPPAAPPLDAWDGLAGERVPKPRRIRNIVPVKTAESPSKLEARAELLVRSGAKTYVHGVKLFPVLLLCTSTPTSAEEILPITINCEEAIKQSHDGQLPPEFRVQKHDAAQSCSECSDDLSHDEDSYDSSEEDVKVDIESTSQDKPELSSELSELSQTSTGGAVKGPAKRKRFKDDHYDSDDSFINDSDEFVGNVGLMRAERAGFFINLGPVKSAPLDGVELDMLDFEPSPRKRLAANAE